MNPNSRPRLPLVNAASNTVALLAFLAVQFFLTPVTLKALGDARYGVWSFVESFIAYIMLFDLGVAASLVSFVPRLMATEDRAGLTRTFSACFAFFLGAAGLALVVGALFLVAGLELFLNVPPGLKGEVRWLFLTLIGNFAVALALSVFPAMLDGLQAFVAKSATRTAFLLLRVPLVLLALQSRSPMLALAAAVTVCNLLEQVTLAVLVFRRLPWLRFAPRSIDRATFAAIRGYSVDSFLAMIAGRLAFQTDAFVIGSCLPLGAITTFAIPSRLTETAKSLMRAVTMTLTPAISALEAKNEHGAIRALFLQGTRLTLYLVLPVQIGLFVLGHAFLRLWINPAFADDSARTLYMLASTLSLTVALSMAARVLYGVGRIRLFARASLLEGTANLLISIILVVPFGVEGVAFGTALPHAALGLFTIVHVCRLVRIGLTEYVSVALLKPTASGLILAGTWTWMLRLGIPKTWADLIVTGSIGILTYAVAVAILESGTMRIIRLHGPRTFARQLQS